MGRTLVRVIVVVTVAVLLAHASWAHHAHRRAPGAARGAHGTTDNNAPAATTAPPGPVMVEDPPDRAVDENEAVTVATRLVRAWAHPHVPAVEWMRGMSAYLTDRARRSFAHVDPETVPATAVGPLPATVISRADGQRVITVHTNTMVVYVTVVTTPAGLRVDALDRASR